MRESSATHLVLIPSYNPGPRVFETVRAALEQWSPVWVVVDGSTDGSTLELQRMESRHPGLRVLVIPHEPGQRRRGSVRRSRGAALAASPTH